MTQQPGNPHQPEQPGQPQGGYGQQGQPQQGGAPQYQQQGYLQQGGAPQYQQQGYPQQPPKPKGESFFGQLLDFSFAKLHAEKLAKFAFLIVVIAAAAAWLVQIIDGIVWATIGRGFDVWPFLEPLLFGWIWPLLVILLARFLIELTVAAVRTSEKK